MDSDCAPIYLIGYRGTGKSIVARSLAQQLGCEWFDTDDWIEQQAGKSILQVFTEDGEPSFREWEVRAVETLSKKGQAVVALGGGAILRDENRRTISHGRAVVWLTASVDTILTRLTNDPTTASRRPRLSAASNRSEVEIILDQRMPLYRECATLIVNTEGKSAEEVAAEIAEQLT